MEQNVSLESTDCFEVKHEQNCPTEMFDRYNPRKLCIFITEWQIRVIKKKEKD